MNKPWLVVAVGVGLVVAAFTPLPERAARWMSGERVSAQGCSPDAPKANLNFTLKDMNGKDLELADLKGKVVLLNFWATWCGPCRLEIPWLVDLQQKYRDKGLRVVGISVDDPPEALPPFAKEFKINYPLVVGLDREDVQSAFGPIFAVPITLIIGRDGKVCVKHIGPVAKEQFESEIKSLL
ncbi:MAG TPA: TlpA disulfide reductase family protein [Vicinamibacterales bacterium]|jgi:thiol-disulfide isomerase/thioredoxin